MKTYPRYFIGRLWNKRDAYLRFDSQYQCVWVRNDGKETPQSEGPEWDADKPCDTWNEVTPEMAQARLLPEARPLRWVENCVPDKPGIWLRNNPDGHIDAACINGDEVLEWNRATRCYLGPIPEILPPKKKVVQRLWVLPQDGEAGICRWFHGDEPMAVGWIRTDRTREVEQ